MEDDLKIFNLREAEAELFQVFVDKEEAAEEFKVRIEEVVNRMEPGTSKDEIDAVKKYAEARAKAKMKAFMEKHDACERIITELASHVA